MKIIAQLSASKAANEQISNGKLKSDESARMPIIIIKRNYGTYTRTHTLAHIHTDYKRAQVKNSRIIIIK